MSGDGTETLTPGGLTLSHIKASEKNPIARLTVGYWNDRPGHEAMVALINPIGQQLALYVSAGEKARFIAETRAALAAWEKMP